MIELHLRFGHRPIAIALEQRRGALVIMLSKYAQVHLYPVHPLTLARFREAWVITDIGARGKSRRGS